MKDDVYPRIEAFVRERLWEPKHGLHPGTRLYEDIGIAGLDGHEFMQAFAAEFKVDLTGFDYTEYFGVEGLGCLPLAPFEWLYDRLSSAERPVWPDVTLGDLTRWAQAGKWERP